MPRWMSRVRIPSTAPHIRCHSQVVRRRSAKPLFPGSNPGGTSRIKVDRKIDLFVCCGKGSFCGLPQGAAWRCICRGEVCSPVTLQKMPTGRCVRRAGDRRSPLHFAQPSSLAHHAIFHLIRLCLGSPSGGAVAFRRPRGLRSNENQLCKRAGQPSQSAQALTALPEGEPR